MALHCNLVAKIMYGKTIYGIEYFLNVVLIQIKHKYERLAEKILFSSLY